MAELPFPPKPPSLQKGAEGMGDNTLLNYRQVCKNRLIDRFF